MARKRLCQICYEAPYDGQYEYSDAGHTVILWYCNEHKQHAQRKAEQWRLETAQNREVGRLMDVPKRKAVK
jgi:hypothetical protein